MASVFSLTRSFSLPFTTSTLRRYKCNDHLLFMASPAPSAAPAMDDSEQDNTLSTSQTSPCSSSTTLSDADLVAQEVAATEDVDMWDDISESTPAVEIWVPSAFFQYVFELYTGIQDLTL